MTLVKMCGLHRLQDIDYINEVGPDMAGMVLSPGFRRTVPIRVARTMAARLNHNISSVGVFVDSPVEEVSDIARFLELDMVQLHGAESDAYIVELQETLGLPVIKSFGVSRDQLEMATISPADFILIDPGRGSGNTFDLSLLDGLERNVIIAGGLTPDNVADAIRKAHPFGVDTSSGIETDGSKDRKKMIRFISAVRAEDAQLEEKK